ncbi:hypothetical protein AB4Z34_12900 [Ensifer sp. 2YAB10]|uniref:hypothetical protein n=1 Tax=Ensifer TaxID=106591 RepID=UPI0005BA6DF8|nr:MULTISPECIES: hypothetical protein [Ensifer]MBZ7921972.1 hypothetical protein [Ensifer adhaerens]UAX94364.1 hypothetical protein LAC78_09265 [Ensifer adhaerens]UAY01999.1 hypothetical protein LAC80_09275 [Ensifer adhaerens]UAY09382.1 hypothetical protein LAC81_09270 [Ensifer adhaerens]
MSESNLYRIVEVTVKREGGRRDLGIMTVRQALELPQVPSLEYSHPELNSRSDGRFLTRDQLQAYAQCA